MDRADSDFNAIRIMLASPEQIRSWSHGEVTSAATINYRTLKPERKGLFCERIFGPEKNWTCSCGRYREKRHKGVVCEMCGVEVARARVRRERMGHITLAAPAAHIWYSRGVPNRIGLLLDMRSRDLEGVLHFTLYVVTSVDSEAREARVEEILREADAARERIEGERDEELASTAAVIKNFEEVDREEYERRVRHRAEGELTEHEHRAADLIDPLEELHVGQVLTETRFREYRDRYGGCFEAGMGAEAILQLLRGLDLNGLSGELREAIELTSGLKRKRVIRRLEVVEAFRRSGNNPEWMVLSILPVLPPELRPLLDLGSNRFVTSDLNALYRRVINRNNRLKRLMRLSAPEIIVRNEKRMLQEAVDALIDNRVSKNPVTNRGNSRFKLKALSDLLRGKQGRFRQNLLGKRVDYSGRSVIIVGPELRVNQCGLPRYMALELFKPYIINRLVKKGYAHNAKHAGRVAESETPQVLEVLEEVVRGRPVILNRAPTLHRLGVQAFEPILVDGKAIRLHPLVCSAFNADFDGDQMGVHLPLSREAVMEARRLMMSKFNILSPSSGEPIMAPALDMVLGCYYITLLDEAAKGAGKEFRDFEDTMLAYEFGTLGIRAPITVRVNGEWLETSLGRMIFNSVLPDEMEYVNEPVEKGALKRIVGRVYALTGSERTGEVLDSIKELGFRHSTMRATTIAISDLVVPKEKAVIISETEAVVSDLEEKYLDGLLAEEERYQHTVEAWTRASDRMTEVIKNRLEEFGGIHLMAGSGAKGNVAQIKQMAGMRGLMAGPKGRIIDRPIKANFKEGLSMLEFFISAHGARKGLTDTALNTANSGYLTRRLVDVSQDLIVLIPDCGSSRHLRIDRDDGSVVPFFERIRARYLAAPVSHPSTGELLGDFEDPIDDELAELLDESGVAAVAVRTPMMCEAPRGVCQMCYGLSMATLRPVLIGEAVGIIAAQSIGEPGTQLTMRTFHSGGVAGRDITDGLPRVEELFEARTPKFIGVVSEIGGVVEVNHVTAGSDAMPTVLVRNAENYEDRYEIPQGYEPVVSSGDLVTIGEPLAERSEEGVADGKIERHLGGEVILSRVSGDVSLEPDGDQLIVYWTEREEREYTIPSTAQITVKSGDKVYAGQQLSDGPLDPQEVMRVRGREAVQRYIIEEVQKVYRSQGVPIHSKHIELIVNRMARNVAVENPGDSSLIPDEVMNARHFEGVAARVLAGGGSPPTSVPVLLGITKSAMTIGGNTDSFLAAASFQETTRILADSAINGRVDRLAGMKENVIIGRQIPAKLNLSDEGVWSVPQQESAVPLQAIGRNGTAEGSSPDDESGGSATEMAQADLGE